MRGTLATKRRRDLRAQRGQFVAAGIVALLGVAMFGASYDSYRNLRLSYNDSHREFRFADLQVDGGPYPDALAARAARISGIEAAAVRPVVDTGIQVQGDRVQGRLVGVPAGHQPSVDRLKILEGRYLSRATAGSTKQRTGSRRDLDVLVERHFAEARHLTVGDRLKVLAGRRQLFARATGIVASPEYIWPAPSLDDVFVPPKEFGVLFADRSRVAPLAGGMNQLLLYEGGKRKRGADRSALALARPYGVTAAIPKSQQPSNRVLQLDLDGFRQMAVFFPLLFLLVAALALYVLVGRLVQAQREIVGYLRAEGASRGLVMRHYLGFGLIVACVGGLIGIPLGALLGWQITKLYTSALAIPTLTIELHPSTWVVGLGLVLATGVAAGALPARAAGRVPPAKALRGLLPAQRGRRSLVERILPPIRYLPRLWRMVLRDAERNPRRSLATILAVVLALVLMLSGVGLIDSTVRLIDVQFEQVQREDADAYLGRGVPTSQAIALAHRAGATDAVPAITGKLVVRSNKRTGAAGLWGFPHDNRLHELPGGGPPPGGVLLGKGLADSLKVKAGDVLTLDRGRSRVRAKLAGTVSEPLTAVAYTTLETAARLAGGRAGAVKVNVVQVAAPPGGRQRMIDRLERDPGVQAVRNAATLRNTINSYLWLMYTFSGVMLAFGAGMAFALIFSTVSANLAERRREVGTLRTIGMGRGRLGFLLGAETVYVVALGIVPGLLAGNVSAGYAVSQYSDEQFYYPLEIFTRSYLLAVVALLLAGAISFWVAWRALKNESLAMLVREHGS